ncbi:MAG: hypothetical protein RR911_04345 [Oscillospiraceae bacterium]
MDKKKKDNPKIDKVTKEISDIWQENNAEFATDVLGSYTGTGKNDLVPEQDADDL